MDVLELPDRTRLNVRWKPLRRAGREELFCPMIGEGLDHDEM
jgi:hypothetical protein